MKVCNFRMNDASFELNRVITMKWFRIKEVSIKSKSINIALNIILLISLNLQILQKYSKIIFFPKIFYFPHFKIKNVLPYFSYQTMINNQENITDASIEYS